ncbi:MAG: hypothetical protein ACYCSN_15435 [Acidobacteriaceae bacterium]
MFASRSELTAIANALSARAQRRHERDRLAALQAAVNDSLEITSRAQAAERAAFLKRAMARRYAQSTIDTGLAEIDTRYAQNAPTVYQQAETAAAQRLRAATGGSSTRPGVATGGRSASITKQQAKTTRNASVRNAASAPGRLWKGVTGGNTFTLAIVLLVLILLLQIAIVPIRSGDAKGETKLKALSGVFSGQYEVVA